MTLSELTDTIERMRIDGGNFYGKLGEALAGADPINRDRLLKAFPEIESRYGPNSINAIKDTAWAHARALLN